MFVTCILQVDTACDFFLDQLKAGLAGFENSNTWKYRPLVPQVNKYGARPRLFQHCQLNFLATFSRRALSHLVKVAKDYNKVLGKGRIQKAIKNFDRSS